MRRLSDVDERSFRRGTVTINGVAALLVLVAVALPPIAMVALAIGSFVAYALSGGT